MAGTHHVFFTVANKGTFYGVPSNVGWERGMEKWIDMRGRSSLSNFLTKGFVLAAGSGLSVDIGTTDVSGSGETSVKGEAIVSGRVVQLRTGSDNLAGLTDSRGIKTPNFVFLQLSRTSELVTDFSYVANTTGTAPTDSVLIGIAATSGGVVTAVDNSKTVPSVVASSYSGDSDTVARNIFLGAKPKFVLVQSDADCDTDTGGDQRIFSTSGLTDGSSVLGLVMIATVSGSPLSGAAGVGITGKDTDRPEIYDWGFKVRHGGASTSGLNKTGITYRYVAFF